jgi:hypothetical protein
MISLVFKPTVFRPKYRPNIFEQTFYTLKKLKHYSPYSAAELISKEIDEIEIETMKYRNSFRELAAHLYEYSQLEKNCKFVESTSESLTESIVNQIENVKTFNEETFKILLNHVHWRITDSK